jgi:Asp-tRNA(Asn)/Glu-tRNA(Gln) amidotransferase A subunit family amidase
MADLFRLSASEAAARIREGELTSEALVRPCLERIDAREPQVKAWVHLDRDFALAQARECDPEHEPSSDSRSSVRCQGHHGHG